MLFGPGTSTEPKCTLNVENVHESTHLKEQKNVQALKLNITSVCNVEQRFTTLDARIDQILHLDQTTTKTFENVTVLPSHKDRTKAHFLDLIVICERSLPILYGGYAKGEVELKDGRKIQVKGSSKEFKTVPCAVEAK